MTYEEQKKRTLDDPTSSYWLKDAIQALDERDPVDALHDARALAGAQQRRCDEIKQATWPEKAKAGTLYR